MLDRALRNWPLKLLALALAYAIWVAVTGENKIVQDFRVPLDIRLPSDLIPDESPPTTVSVRLRGPETVVRRTDPVPLEMSLDLRDASAGARNVQLSPADLSGVPEGVEVALIEPDRFRLVLDRRMRRVLPVVPSLQGQPPQGRAVYGVRVTPDSLEVEGPESKVKSLTRLRTDPIPLEGHASSFTTRVRAVPDGIEVRVLDPRPLVAQVDVDAASVTASFEGVPVVLAGQVHEANASPSSLRVSLSGPPALLRGIRPAQLRAVADVSGLLPRPEPYYLPVRIDFLEMPPSDLARITVKSTSRPKIAVAVSDRRISR